MKHVTTREIRTERLVLRRFKAEDSEAIYANYGSDLKVRTYINYVPCITLEATKAFVDWHLGQYDDPDFYSWVITLDDVVIGTIGIFHVDQDNESGEIGYSIGSRWWHRGYVSEAALAVRDYAFKEICLHRLFATCHKDNVASSRVLEKIGMTFEGLMRQAQKNSDGTYSDLRLYAVTAEDIA